MSKYTPEVIAAALEGSITAWEKRTAGEHLEVSIDSCPLCALLIDNDCKGCPVYKKTEQIHCMYTPCDTYSALYNDIELYDDEDPDWDELKQAAQDEVDFLKSLRTTVKEGE